MLQILHCHKSGGYPEQPISPQSLLLAYNETEAGSKLRQWALDQFKFNLQRKFVSSERGVGPCARGISGPGEGNEARVDEIW